MTKMSASPGPSIKRKKKGGKKKARPGMLGRKFGISKAKAEEMMSKPPHGGPNSPAQKRLFGAISHGG